MKETPLIFSTEMIRAILENKKSITRRTRGLAKINECPDDWQFFCHVDDRWTFHHKKTEEIIIIKCPYGQVGSGLWIRETFCQICYKKDSIQDICYKEDLIRHNMMPSETVTTTCKPKWSSSRFMPKWASRITLEITGIGVERLWDITEADAIKEGVIRYPERFKHNQIYRALTNYHYGSYPVEHHFTKGEQLRFNYPSLGYANFYALGRPDGEDGLVILKPKDAFSLLEDESIFYREAFTNTWNKLNTKRGYGWDKNPWCWPIEFKR